MAEWLNWWMIELLNTLFTGPDDNPTIHQFNHPAV
jgi:hypothetical protein